ncbi:MAG: DUF2339 domain-containing protein, partial [Parachlamydiaceae bacterium]|nr:DUF2339 domain-containing protein [Parachlamydiaceae bacterium]
MNYAILYLVYNIPFFWGALALTFSMISAYALRKAHKILPENFANKQILMAIYAATSSAFLSIALAIELDREFLSVVFAAQTFALAIIYKKTTINVLRYLSGILAALCMLILIPQILEVVQAIASKKETYSFWYHGWAIIKWPLFQLGLPALLFIFTSYLLRHKEDQKLDKCLETASIFLLSIMGYCLIHRPLQLHGSVLFAKETFFEGSLITNFFFLFGVVCFWIGRKNKRSAVSLSGIFLSGFAVVRLCYYDILIENPFWTHVA